MSNFLRTFDETISSPARIPQEIFYSVTATTLAYGKIHINVRNFNSIGQPVDLLTLQLG